MTRNITEEHKESYDSLAAIISQFSSAEGVQSTAIPGLNLIRSGTTTMPLPTVYQPSLCLIVQGEKEVMLEQERYRYYPSTYLVVSVDLPLTGEITIASVDAPYLCAQVNLDPAQLFTLLEELKQPIAPSDVTRGIFVGDAEIGLVNAVMRLTQLLKTPQDIPILAPLMMREIYYRLLTGSHGAAIQQLALAGSHLQRIASVITHIKHDITQPIRVESLASMANMSSSSFHHHFKQITAMSPLQYQKRLRLMEARRLMLNEQMDAANASYRVGYESASQFSREYARMFGAPPISDVTRLRASA